MYIFKAAVIGAGTMGSEIAQVISYSGLPVVLKDVEQRFVDKGLERIKSIYYRRVKSGKMSQGEADSKIGLVVPAVDYKEFKDVDIVIEAVPEKMEMKQKIFAELDQVCPSTTLLASNTSALSISEMASATRRAPRVVGLHFFFPASVMKLVEVIAGRETSDETMDTAVEFTESLRKLPVRVKECPGFLVNRVLMASMAEVLRFQEETGTPYSDIDDLMKAKGGAPMGPFVLTDSLGLDIALDTARTLEAAYGERFTPPNNLVELVKAGHLGAKAGKGFFDYTG
ncbi:MAG TPA: 3-hydroxyacyl-CoA dehydrogenase family protein [Bacillota bacterium]